MILVTGATGLVGSYLCRQLIADGKQVRAIRRKSSALTVLGDAADKIEWVYGDVTDVSSLEYAMPGVEQIYHCAAYVGYAPKDREMVFKINVEGTANVVNLAIDFGVKKLLHVSSIAALGKDVKKGVITESTEYQDSKYNSIYGQSKFLAEQEAWRGMAEGLDVVVVNPSLILGAGRWNTSSLQVFSKLDEGVSFYSKGSSGYVDVRDLVDIMISLMMSDINGERYIVNAENWDYKTMFGNISQKLGKKPPHIALSGWLANLAVAGDWLKSKITGGQHNITKELILLMQNTYEYDNSKVKKALDFEFRPVEKSVEEICKLYLDSKIKGKDYAIFGE